MTTTALFLLSLSAFAHAFWNYLGKRRSPSAAFFLIATLSALACLLPVAIFFRSRLVVIPAELWGWILLTGGFQAIYFVGLAGAYRSGDLSVAYPLARALPVLLITAISAAVGTSKPVSFSGAVGIALVVAGCLLVPMPDFRALRLSTYRNRCCAMAVVAAAGTTGYTLIDSAVLARLRGLPGWGLTMVQTSLLYMALETASIALMLGIFVAVTTAERERLHSIRKNGWRAAAVTGVIITATYGLVLVAMAFVTNIGYLAAFRQLSIPLGALLGILAQKEAAPAPKVIGIAGVMVGLVMIALA